MENELTIQQCLDARHAAIKAGADFAVLIHDGETWSSIGDMNIDPIKGWGISSYDGEWMLVPGSEDHDPNCPEPQVPGFTWVCVA